jgi:hypothetical protein
LPPFQCPSVNESQRPEAALHDCASGWSGRLEADIRAGFRTCCGCSSGGDIIPTAPIVLQASRSADPAADLTTAKALNLSVPRSLLARTDAVIV